MKFYKEAVVSLIVSKEKFMHGGELYVFAIAVYASKLFAVHIFDLILSSVYHAGTLLMKLKCILIKRISQPLTSSGERFSQLEHLHCLGTFISG